MVKVVSDDDLNGLVFVDCEANGECPGIGELTEFGAVIIRRGNFSTAFCMVYVHQ